MKIAYIGSKGLPSKSGAERVVEALVYNFAATHEVTIYCDARYTPRKTTVNGVRLIRMPTIKGKHLQATSLFFLSALHALFGRYDLIHVHGVDTCFILPILRLRYKVVSTSHGAPGRLIPNKWGRVARFIIRLMEYPFVHLSNGATSVSKPDADYFKARYKRDIIYIPNGVEGCIHFDLEKANNKLSEVGLAPGNYLMFAAGRVDPIKGCHLVIEALNRIGNPCKIAVVGDLNQVPTYSNHIRDIADKKQVVFIPLIADRELLFGMIKMARLFIFPSTHETMSMMLLEAASLQAPIICSDIPENKIVMQENVLYFHSGDSEDLARQIQWAIDHLDEMAILAEKASLHIKNTLTWEKIVGQYDEIYKTIDKS